MQAVLGFIGVWLLARFLGPADYGVVAMAGTLIVPLATLSDAGVTQTLVRLPVVGRPEQAAGFWLALGGASTIFFICVATAPLLGAYYNVGQIALIAVVLGTQFLLAAPGRVSTALLTREIRFRDLAVVSLTANVVGLGFALAAATAGLGPWAIVVQTLGTFGTQAGLLLTAHGYSAAPRLVDRAALRSIGGFSALLAGANLIFVLARSGDTVIGGRLLGPSALGILGMPLRFGFFPIQRLAWAVAGVFFPAVARLGPADQPQAFLRVLRLLLIVSAPVCAFVATASPEITSILPPRWQGLNSVLPWVAVGSFAEPAAALAWMLLVARAPGRLLVGATTALVPVAWLGSFVGAAAGSASSLALTWALTSLIWAACLLVLAVRTAHVPLARLRLLIAPIGAGLACAGSVVLAREVASPPWRFWLSILFAFVTFLAFGLTAFRRDLVGVAKHLSHRETR